MGNVVSGLRGPIKKLDLKEQRKVDSDGKQVATTTDQGNVGDKVSFSPEQKHLSNKQRQFFSLLSSQSFVVNGQADGKLIGKTLDFILSLSEKGYSFRKHMDPFVLVLKKQGYSNDQIVETFAILYLENGIKFNDISLLFKIESYSSAKNQLNSIAAKWLAGNMKENETCISIVNAHKIRHAALESTLNHWIVKLHAQKYIDMGCSVDQIMDKLGLYSNSGARGQIRNMMNKRN